MRSIVLRCIGAFAALDLVFNPLVTAAFIQLLGFEVVAKPFGLLALMWLAKIAANSWFLATQLRAVDALDERADASQLRTADARLQELPRRFGLFYAFSWSLTYGLGLALIYWAAPELRLDPRALHATALVMVAVWFGGLSFAFPIASMLTSEVAGQLSNQASERGISLGRSRSSLQVRIGVIALALGLGPTLWMMALGYMKQVEANTQNANLFGRLAAQSAAAEYEQTGALRASDDAEPELGFAVERRLVPLAAEAAGLTWLPAEARHWLERQPRSAQSAVFQSATLQTVVAFVKVDESRAVIALDTKGQSPTGFMLSSGLFALVVGLWAPLCAVALGRSVSAPLERLTASAREIVEEGKQSQMKALPVPRLDEVGTLSQRFNELIAMMSDLSIAADAIASGDLHITVERKGELPDAFRRMLVSLRAMVSEIRDASVSLGAAATEIFAATQEQEAAATSQSSAMEEISRTMDSLSESAAHVSDSVRGVLSNAERALDNTDEMVGRIGQLSTHAGRIAEILDVIREIADRSDLLALNGSLEASRAGEGGQGFALVAAEMRRLAERVTASVEDIKKLVTDIRDSGSSTVMATEESKRLAQETTEAARKITFVTQQQRSGTEQVSQSVKNIAEVVTQAVSATSQTRTSAEGLKRQADRLSDVVKQFENTDAKAAE
jgi:methyl-accepting chemotaxis protein